MSKHIDENNNVIWYAVQRNTEDDWGTGSLDKNEALEMLNSNEDYQLIAVIENGVCIEEIYKD